MALQDNSSDLAETMIRWKVLTEDKDSEEEDQLPSGIGPLLQLASPALESLLHIARHGPHGRSPPSLPDESSWSSVLESSAALEAALEAGNRVAAQEKAAAQSAAMLLDRLHSAGPTERRSASAGRAAPRRVVWWDNPDDLVPTSRPQRSKAIPRESNTATAPPNLWQPSKATCKSPWRTRNSHAAQRQSFSAARLQHSLSAIGASDVEHVRSFLPGPSGGSRSKVPM
eukprot:2535930-Amphidinium_carterae.1